MGDSHYFDRRPSSKPRLGLIRTYLRGRMFEFLTASGVFSRKRIDPGTRLLIESMILPEEGTVLDIGCGYGAVGIAAAAFNPKLRVVMTDVNERAVWLARENAKRNYVSNVEVRRGDLYEPVKDMRFHAILSNPPISAGMRVVTPIITEAPKHLVDGGLLQIVVRTRIGGRKLRQVMEQTFGDVEVLARGGGYRVLLSKNHQP